ncbi:unnamed protein product [Cylicostephanus goldi]|uniref:Uncharacterized protein n=1 Tax=Cylicostephanus goldi TaxID=71465 RepID=A0A3P7N686_CYLGO|nr:unnamed protein product [Cylicostephanus goldi]
MGEQEVLCLSRFSTLPIVGDSIWRLTMYNNLNAMVLFLPLIGELGEVIYFRRLFNVLFWMWMSLSGVFGFAMGYVTGWQIQVENGYLSIDAQHIRNCEGGSSNSDGSHILFRSQNIYVAKRKLSRRVIDPCVTVDWQILLFCASGQGCEWSDRFPSQYLQLETPTFVLHRAVVGQQRHRLVWICCIYLREKTRDGQEGMLLASMRCYRISGKRFETCCSIS